MRKYTILILLAGCLTLLDASSPVQADTWNLPQRITSDNTKITFEVDSTWHLIEGKANQVDGEVWLSDPKDFRTVRARVTVPVERLDTDNGSRDSKMREVMHSESSPQIEFVVDKPLSTLCDPHGLSEGNETSCHLDIPGMLIINRVPKGIVLVTDISRVDGDYRVEGKATIRWRDFDIEDPSILIARLHEDVTIHIDLTLKDGR